MKERNSSNLTKALAVVSLLAPATGLPLSIGDIELHSALNQSLNAEIKLRVAPGENPADVTVRLAPPEKFDQAGIPWSYFLSKIKLDSVVQPNGTIIVKVTSKETLTEPFLDFLLEVSWPQGSQYREYTLLIDPPAAYNQPAVPVVDGSAFRAEPIEGVERPVRKVRHAARKPSAKEGVASNITPQTPTSGEYGPVQRSETLWHIASQLGNERGVPANQMLIALYKANPDAFNQNDINALKEGATLKIPETEAILKSSKKPTPASPVPKETSPGTKPLELVAPVESKIAEKAVVSGQPGQPAAEAGKVAEGADLELQARIDKLEQQLNMMQQLLELKDKQLAALQAGKEMPEAQPLPTPEQPGVPEVQPPAAEQVAPPPEEAPAPPPPVAPAPKPTPAPVVRPAPTPAPAPEESIFSSESYYVTMGGLGAGILGVLGWLLWRRRKLEEETNTESMFASASEIRMPDSESSLSVPVMELGSSSAYDVGTVGESSFISDFTPSDFDAFDTEQNEVDPLSEADVYLAYGRYQQAEELIRHALEAEPDRDDFKLKLLEIFYAGENKDGFAAFTQQLAAEGKQNDRAFWNKVSEMAKEIVSDLPLFGGAPVSEQHAPVEESLEDEELKTETPTADRDEAEFGAVDLDFDAFESSGAADDSAVLEQLDAEFSDMKRDFSEASTADENSLDFDLGSSAGQSVKHQEQPLASSEEIESIEFDLGALSVDDTEKAQGGEAELDTFDFNFDIDAAAEAPAAESKLKEGLGSESVQAEEHEAFDFSSFDVAEPEVEQAEKKPETSSSEEGGEFEFNFDFDTPIVAGKDEDEFNLGVSDLTDMDEFETKIDLAKAYMDMGDAEAAKSIAEEVLSKGSKEQKVAAQALLDELK